MATHGKKYRTARAQIDPERTYTPVEAVRMLKDFEGPKFDETVEAHFRLGLNVRHADQQLRGTLMLPHGTGREMRVAVFAEGDKAREQTEDERDATSQLEIGNEWPCDFRIWNTGLGEHVDYARESELKELLCAVPDENRADDATQNKKRRIEAPVCDCCDCSHCDSS